MNIKLEELRIGNWLHDDNLCEACQVDMQIMGKIDFNQNEVVCDSGFDGVKLTPEILVDSGFTANDSDGEYLGCVFTIYPKFDSKQTRFTLHKDINRDEYEFEHYFDESSKIRPHKPIQYIHQLQNLYFALYGEELNIVL